MATHSKDQKRVRTVVRSTEPGEGQELTREEELVVRMTRGAGEDPSYALEWQDPVEDETRAKIALIEQQALARVMQAQQGAPGEGVDPRLRAWLRDRLAKLDE